MIAVDVKLMYKFVVSYFVSWLPLVKWNKICLPKTPVEIPALFEPIRDALIGHQQAKVFVEFLYVAVQRTGRVECPKAQQKHLVDSREF